MNGKGEWTTNLNEINRGGYMKKSLLLFAVIFPIIGFCQDQSVTTTLAVVTTTLAPAAAAVVAQTSKIPSSIPAWVLGVLVFFVEMIMRVWPTVKPRSLFILVGQLFGALGDGFKKISALFDIVVQNLKEPEVK